MHPHDLGPPPAQRRTRGGHTSLGVVEAIRYRDANGERWEHPFACEPGLEFDGRELRVRNPNAYALTERGIEDSMSCGTCSCGGHGCARCAGGGLLRANPWSPVAAARGALPRPMNGDQIKDRFLHTLGVCLGGLAYAGGVGMMLERTAWTPAGKSAAMALVGTLGGAALLSQGVAPTLAEALLVGSVYESGRTLASSFHARQLLSQLLPAQAPGSYPMNPGGAVPSSGLPAGGLPAGYTARTASSCGATR